MTFVLTELDVQQLNIARLALRAISDQFPESADEGRAIEAAVTAGDAIFNLLNVANSYGLHEVSADQLHLESAVSA